MTKDQAVFMQTAFRELIGERPLIEASWYEYKAHSTPLEVSPRKLEKGWKDTKEYVYINEHEDGDCSFAISTDYGITSAPDNFADITISADSYTIHFRHFEFGEMYPKVKIYRAFKLLPDTENGYSSEMYFKWREMMQESWKVK